MDNDDNLYKSLYDEDDTLEDDIGPNMLYEMYSHLDFEDMSKYFSIEQYNNTFPSNVNNIFSIMHMNTRSILKKIDKINIFFASLKKNPDIFSVTETWLSDSNKHTATINGYKAYHLTRANCHDHGGVSCYINDALGTELVEEYSYINELIELLTIKVKVCEEYYLISTVYRPSSKQIDVDVFDKMINKLLKNDIFKKSKHILIGDFNINLLEFSTHLPTNQFLNTMQNFKYIPLIARPTRFPDGNQRGSHSLLDHIYVNFVPPSISGIIKHIVTDHRPVFFNIPISEGVQHGFSIKFRLINKVNRDLFTRALCDIDWESLLTAPDLNTNFNLFFAKFDELYNKNFPILTRNVNRKQIVNPWITPTLINAIRNRNALYRSYKNGIVTEDFYRNYCSSLNRHIKRTKSDYYTNIFSNFRNNVKKMWENLNKLTGKSKIKNSINNIISDNKILTNPQEISNAFNTFFTNVASNLDSKLPASHMSPDDFLRGEFRTQMDVPNVSINVVFKVIKSLVNKKSSIYDFSPIIIKENMHLIAHPLSKLFNQSIHSGKFPQILKLARITPLYKKGPKHDVNNYRPISQLNIFSKIFEKIMKIYLVNFLNTNEIINKAQFDFQKG